MWLADRIFRCPRSHSLVHRTASVGACDWLPAQLQSGYTQPVSHQGLASTSRTPPPLPAAATGSQTGTSTPSLMLSHVIQYFKPFFFQALVSFLCRSLYDSWLVHLFLPCMEWKWVQPFSTWFWCFEHKIRFYLLTCWCLIIYFNLIMLFFPLCFTSLRFPSTQK